MVQSAKASVISTFLSNLRGGKSPVAFRHDQYVSREDFLNDIARMQARIEECKEDRWGVFMDDAYLFGVALVALLAVGKTPIILPNAQASFIHSIGNQLDALIGDPIVGATELPHLQVTSGIGVTPTDRELPVLDGQHSGIVLFTSGSTGAPKRISKSLAQLETEIAVLEGLWGPRLKDSIILSTVTHQHIYGLLFKLLWPLVSGRCFDSVTYNDPWALAEQTQRFSHIALVSSPAQLTRLPDSLDLTGLASKASMVFSSGGPLPESAALTLRERFGFGVYEVLGSTETGGIAFRSQVEVGLETPWQPLPSVRIKCAPGDNALIINSPFEGSGDWYTTADTVELLPGDTFLLKGRNDNIVKVEEKRLSLTELEHRLCACDLVAEAGAAVQETHRSTVVVVLVLSEEGRHFLRLHSKRELERELKGYLLGYFEPVLLPKKWRYVENLPCDSQGKVTQSALLELFSSSRTGPSSHQSRSR